MSDLKVCRVCLCKGVKMYNYDSFHLKQYYEEIMARKLNEKDGLPNYFCYECAAFLYKFHKFKEKCCMGEKALNELLWSGSITLSSISQKDRQDKNLQSSIDIISISKRVRTCIIKSKTLSKNLQKEKKEDEIPEIENYIIEYDTDSSLDDANLAEIKNEMINENTESFVDGKTNIDIGIRTEKKAVTDLEDDQMFSDDDDDSNSENFNDVDKPAIKEEISNEITIEEERINFNPEQANSDDEIVLNKNHKEIEQKKNKTETDFTDTKSKKFEVKKKTCLDPNHWLKINLTEEEALEEFRARAQDRKYVSAAYKCSDCFKWFSKEDMLNRHIKTRHSESNGPIDCRFCHMRFKWNCFLTQHMRQHYTKYKCLRCDLVCPLESTALLHDSFHSGVTKKCDHCGEVFKHITTYYTHLRTHRSEHVCTLCGASFVSAVGLAKHKRIKHDNADSDIPQGEGQYCQQCDVKFETRKAYEEHLIHSANHVDGIDDFRKRQQNLNRQTKIPTDCNVCGKHFATQAACRKHHLAEHPRTSFFAPNERHICEICGMSLAPISVASHLNTHTREKMYPCNTCGRKFSSKTGVNIHQLTHSSEKPAACTLCDKRFKQSSSMKLHYRTFHLKEPYPKRNRKKKNDDLSKDEYGPEDSDDDMTLDHFYSRK